MILMLNCSYKSKDGNTQYFLDILKRELGECTKQLCKFYKIKNVLENDLEAFAEDLGKAKALVIGAPLYVDGLPAQAVKLLEVLLDAYEEKLSENISRDSTTALPGKSAGIPVYVVSNLGFYEAEQITHLFAIVENWCKRMGMTYGGGLAVGAGPMISTLKNMPLKKGLNKDVGEGFEKLALAISKGESIENYYTKTAIPRFIYLKAAHMTFDKSAKGNGLEVKDVRGK